VVTDGLLDLVETPLEPTHTTNSNVVPMCAVSSLVLDGGVLMEDMAVADPEHPIAGGAVLMFVLMEPKCESTLDILLMHSLRRQGDPVKSSEEATNVVGGISVADMAHQWWTCQPLQDGLAPFHDSVLDSMILEKLEDLLGDVVGGIGGGRIGNDTNPDYDRTKTPLLLLSRRSMDEEAGGVDGRPVNPPSLDQVTDLGTDRAPDTIERGLKNPTE